MIRITLVLRAPSQTRISLYQVLNKQKQKLISAPKVLYVVHIIIELAK